MLNPERSGQGVGVAVGSSVGEGVSLGSGVGGISVVGEGSVVGGGSVGVGVGTSCVPVGEPGVGDGVSCGGKMVPVSVGLTVMLPVIVGVNVIVADGMVAVGGEHSSATSSIFFNKLSSARMEYAISYCTWDVHQSSFLAS